MRGKETFAVLLLSAAVLAVTATATASNWSAGTKMDAPSPVARPLGFGTDETIARTQARLRANPDDARALNQLAAAYLQKVREVGDPAYYARAEALLAMALRQDPTDAEALTLLGTVDLGRHQFLEALEWGQQARTANPYSARALGVIGDAQVELGRYPEAIATFQEMVNLRPDLGSYARVSYARELYGDVPGAIEALHLAIEAGGPVPENAAYTQVLLGNLFFNGGRLAEAEGQYQAALAQYPGYVQALAGLARVRAAEANYPEAIGLYGRAIAVYPAPEYVIALGDVHTAAGDAAGAREAYQLAVAQHRLYGANGVNVDAELALFAADHRRDLPAALEAARRAWQDRPSIFSADILAWTLFQTGDLEGALATSEQAHRLGTQNALFFFHSGMIKARLGMTAEARADLTRALAINPSFSVLQVAEARRTLEGLGGQR